MRKFGKESAASDEGVDRSSGKGWLQNRSVLAVCIIAIISLVLRTVFVYGVSAGGDFALSGGSNAQYHLHVVESILDGSFIFGTDAAVNYPVGGLNVNPPLYDLIAAAVGAISSASFALAVLAPIFGVLTIFPVYLIGKELDGEKVGVIAALIYGLMALPILSSVFSNGNEYAFAGFLFALFTLYFIKVVRKVSEDELAMKEVIISGLLLALIALAWNEFRIILVMLIVTMVIQLVISRFNSKDFTVPLYSYSIMMLICVAIGAAYYVTAGLWDAVFSGPVLITVIAVVFGFIFKALESKPWIFTIPGLILAFGIIAAVLFFAAPDYFTALIFGNSTYSNTIMQEIVSNGVSISKMASYFGWLLMWMPFILGIYEFYVYARYDRSHTQLFKTMWFLIFWIAAWTSFGAASVVGCVFAVSSAYVLYVVFKKADLKTYYTNMKNAGFPGFLRKMIKPVPFLAVIITAFLVVLPGAVYAVDAGISSNETYGYFGYGNTIYTVETGDDYPASYIYEDMENADKSKAVVSWVEYSTDLAAMGFNTVNDHLATGASAAAQIYLAKGSAGATAAQIVRLIEANPDTNFQTCFGEYGSVYTQIKANFADPAETIAAVIDDPDTYGNVNSGITEENAIYLKSIQDITVSMSTYNIMTTYDTMSRIASESIGYYLVDGSMVPLVYGDGDALATMAYFADYAIDGNGAPTQFFSYLTHYSNYYPAMATDALYETFLWKALIGPSPSEAGESSSFAYLYDLSSSNGTVKATPGYGLAGYHIVSWYVKYNPDSTASSSDDGWEYMPYTDAIALQKKDGGLINYLSSIIMYQYDGIGSTSFSGVVTDENGTGIPGITVQITSFNTAYATDVVYSETTTDKDGKFTALMPSGTYSMALKNGNVKLEYTESSSVYKVENAKFQGTVKLGTETDTDGFLYVLEKDGTSIYIPVEDGAILSSNAMDDKGLSVRIIPGTYNYQLRDATAAAVSSGTVTFYAGTNVGLVVTPTSYSVTATVTDFFGNKVETGTVVAVNTSTMEGYIGDIKDGESKIIVPSGTYTFVLSDGYITDYSSTVSVTSDRSVSLKAYETSTVAVTGASNVMLNAYMGSLTTPVVEGSVELPESIGATSYNYTIYGSDGSKVYIGSFTGSGTVSLNSGNACKVTGSIGSAGTVCFIIDGCVVSASADSDGKFSVLLMPGNYTVYAYTDKTSAYLGTESINADKDLGTIKTVDGRKITATYNYSSDSSKGSVGLPFAPATISFSFDSKSWSIPGTTNTSGTVSFVIPDDSNSIKVEFNGGSIHNACFSAENLNATIENGTADTSATVNISKDKLEKVTVSAPYEITLTPYTEGGEIKFDGSATLAPGQYTAEINANTGFYFDGTVYVYPGQTSFSGLNPIEVFGVEITKGALDELTITGDGVHENYNGDNVYYFEYMVSYYLKSYNGSTGYISTGYVFGEKGGSIPTNVDMTTEAHSQQITGYIGVDADGEATLYYGDSRVVSKIEGGAFTFNIPETIDTVDIIVEATATINSETYGYFGSILDASTSSGVINVAVVSDPMVVDHDKDDLDAVITSATFNNGKATVGVRIYNNTDTAKTYAVTAGTAWTLDKSVQIIIGPNDYDDIKLTGKYDQQATGIGSNGMTVIVSDFNGTESKTLHIIHGETTSGGSSVVLKTAADSDNKDKLSGSEYLYALTFVNSGAATEVTINAACEGVVSITLMDQSGAIIVPNGGKMTVAAQTSTVIYVKIMTKTGEMDVVPGISVSTSFGDKNLSPSTMDVEVESMTVTGDSAVDHRSGIPAGLWFIFGLCILLLILIVWMGSKRGVFSRK